MPEVRLAEPESAALGAALQALWTVRREASENVSADALAASFVQMEGETIYPDATRSAVYRDARYRFRELTERIFLPQTTL